MAARDVLQSRQFGDRRIRSISPDDVNEESDRRAHQRRVLLEEKPGEIVHPPFRPPLPR